MKDFLEIKVYEAAGAKTTYLFTLKDLDQSTVSGVAFDRDAIATQIVRERAAVLHNNLSFLHLKPPPVSSDDPYLKKLSLPGAAELGEQALKAIILDQVVLRRLKLKDASEVSP